MFEDIEDAKNELRTRTSKIIGGYITESLFIDKYKDLYPKRSYSKGWWGGVENSEKETLTFFIVKNELTPLDKKVMNNFEKKGFLCKQLICENDIWYIKGANNKVTIEEYVKERDLFQNQDPNRNRKIITGDAELERCIARYEKEDSLREIASSIYIEDHFLNTYYNISNIDLIGEDKEGIPVYIEIKFKNEFYFTHNGPKKLVFGIDEFQYKNLFSAFWSCNMKVMNVILYNDVKDQHNINSTVIFDFLKKKQDINSFIWKYKMINENESFPKHTFLGNTGWSGKQERSVYCIPLKYYSDFGNYSLEENLKPNYPEGSWGVCEKCNEKRVILSNKKNGNEFIGCLGFNKH